MAQLRGGHYQMGGGYGVSSNPATSDPSPLDQIREQTSKIEDFFDTISEPLKPYVHSALLCTFLPVLIAAAVSIGAPAPIMSIFWMLPCCDETQFIADVCADRVCPQLDISLPSAAF